MMAYLDELKQKIFSYNPHCNWDKIVEAYEFAGEAHTGQLRHSGENYIVHPMSVAMILTEVGADDSTIIAGLLHDVVEDTDYTEEDITEKFGEDVALLIDGVTKLGKLKGHTKGELKMENLRKMFFAMATDIRVIIIKLADRLHNMRTLKYHDSVEKRKDIAQETLDIYTPLANRLGIFQFKWEMEDLALRELEPDKYYALVEEVAGTREKRLNYINQVTNILEGRLKEAHIKGEISGRPKNFYSIYKKMVNQNKELSEIYDLLAVRVIVDTVADCYGVLGIVHSLWKPMPGRFKDYIAMPKQNMYQSIHTTIVSPNGDPLEVQIRTHEMHEVAEHGVASHWRYKEGGPASRDDNKLNWLRQMLDWQKEVRDADEFMESVKNDLFDEQVFIFTPKGDVYELPAGSVPLDFAYRVHTEVGHKAVGAKVNGRIVTFDYRLQTGDIVEIITAKNGKPSRDWLNLVKTPQARSKIRNWFRKEQRDEIIQKGKDNYEREIKKYGEQMVSYLTNEKLNHIAKKHNFTNIESFYVALGEGHLAMAAVINKIKEKIKFEAPPVEPELRPFKETKGGENGIVVRGIDNVMVRLGHCCNPLPGDEITGFITRGKGITVHRKDCVSLKAIGDPARLIEVDWEQTTTNTGHFQAEIEVEAQDRDRLTIDVITAISETKTTINTVYGRSLKNGMALIDVKIEVKSNSHLEFIMNKIRRIKNVVEVRRVIHSKGAPYGEEVSS